MSRRRQVDVYRAEDAALAGWGRRFSGWAEAQRYVDELLAGDWWGDRWPEVDRVVVGRSRSRRWDGYAVPGAGEVRLAARREPVLLHELAHVVTPGDGHGGAFVAAFCDLVRHRMGFHAYGELVHELRRAGAFTDGGGVSGSRRRGRSRP